MGRAYVAYAIENPEHYRIMFMARFDLSAQEYAEEMVAEGGAFTMLLRAAEDLIASGRVRPEVAERGPLHVGILVWSAVHGLSSLLIAKPGLPVAGPRRAPRRRHLPGGRRHHPARALTVLLPRAATRADTWPEAA